MITVQRCTALYRPILLPTALYRSILLPSYDVDGEIWRGVDCVVLYFDFDVAVL